MQTRGLAALWLTHCPLVVLLNERLTPLSGLDVLQMVSEDEGGRLIRHGYALMTTTLQQVASTNCMLMQQMAVPILAQSFDLDELFALVDRVNDQVRSHQIHVAIPSVTPAGATTTARLGPLQTPETGATARSLDQRGLLTAHAEPSHLSWNCS